MKRILSLLLTMCLIMSTFSFYTSAEEPDISAVRTNVQPRLNGETDLSVGNSWTDVKKDFNLTVENVTVTNSAKSVYKVDIRIVDYKGNKILADSQTISSGYDHTFFNIRAGGYIIQAKSTDGASHEYTISYTDK